MRINLPVTQREFPFPSGRTLVSTTDLQGRILYCNPAFIEVSGYTRQELLGQPHNLIRHPDMPAEAFRDLWATIQCGQPWSALVKNRRKNGDHYWVMANVTPLFDGAAVTGYVSVRTEASRADIEAAEALYATLRAEAAAGKVEHRLERARVQRSGRLTGWLRHLRGEGVGAYLGPAMAAAAGAAAGGLLSQGHRVVGAVAVVATVALCALVGRWLNSRSLHPLRGLLHYAYRLAGGDLTQRLDARSAGVFGDYERALNQLSVNLRAIVGDARTEVDGLRGTAAEVASGNQDLSARTESQASSLQHTASSMEQITGTVKHSADAARGVASFARQATDITQRSAAAVHRVTDAMTDISQSSTRIGDIIQVIDSIAFQTNILALNAAVEAARAGDQGRGFAVVAGEVRLLAQRTSTAAREVKQLIEESAQRVQVGASQSTAARQTMDEALDAVQRMGALVGEIEHGTSEQLTGISQVNEAVSHMDALTQQNAALVEELAAAATAVRSQAETVAEAVSIFKLDAQRRGQAAPDAVALRKQMKRESTLS
ncbi:MAG: hypothetical protein RL375_2847 [Pseudomonadota bacterium]